MERDSTGAAAIPHLLRLGAGNYRSDFTSSMGASFKLDEGYSDETRSQTENEAVPPSDDILSLPGWILAHSEADRAGMFAVSICVWVHVLTRFLQSSRIAC
jgi:F-box and WD-40 domain protein 1/11